MPAVVPQLGRWAEHRYELSLGQLSAVLLRSPETKARLSPHLGGRRRAELVPTHWHLLIPLLSLPSGEYFLLLC